MGDYFVTFLCKYVVVTVFYLVASMLFKGEKTKSHILMLFVVVRKPAFIASSTAETSDFFFSNLSSAQSTADGY